MKPLRYNLIIPEQKPKLKAVFHRSGKNDMDVFTKKKRSEIMAKIGSKNTKVELFVFKELKKRKISFQKHYKKVPGSPDMAFLKRKIAIFIDGDFWHGYKFSERKNKLPKKYWLGKITNNIKRDKINRSKLRSLGWKFLRIWEHEIKKNPDLAIKKIIKFIK